MRYVKTQPHKKTCGVVALANALKDTGRTASYKTTLRLLPAAQTSGVSFTELQTALVDLDVANTGFRPTISLITKTLALDSTIGIIVLYQDAVTKIGHFIYINGVLGASFRGFNYEHGTSRILKSQLNVDLDHSHKTTSGIFPLAIALEV